MKKTTIYILAGIGVAGIATYAALMIKKSQQDKKALEFFNQLEKVLVPMKDIESSNGFDSNYYKKSGSTNLISEDKAMSLAKELYSKFGFWGINDDEQGIYSIFRQTDNKAQISQISEKYFEKYKEDLIYTIESQLDEPEQREVMKIVNSKPDK